MKFATALGLTIKLTGYDGNMRVPSEFDENLALGIYMGVDDQNANFNIKAKTDAYELGRTIVRAQQLIGCLTHLGHGVDVLKPSHYFFANNPGEVKKIDKVSISVSSCKTQLLGLFAEQEIAKDLLDMLIKLLRESYRLIPEDTLYNDLKPNIITYQQVITKYCSTDRIVEPAKGKRKALVVKKVPGKPKLSPLLLKSEMDLLNKITAPLFGKTSFEDMDTNEWVNTILDRGVRFVRDHLKSIYNERQVYLTRFAKLTTNRLQAIRKTDLTKSMIKKSAVTVTDVHALLLTRADPITAFVSEVQKLDPTGEAFIAQYFAGDTKTYAHKGVLSDDDIRQLIAKLILDNQVYLSLQQDMQQSHTEWVQRAIQAETALRITKKEYDELRRKVSLTSKPRRFDPHPDNTLWQLIESRAQVQLPKAIGNSRRKVPSSSKKTYKEYVDNIPSKSKKKQIQHPGEAEELVRLPWESDNDFYSPLSDTEKEELSKIEEHPQQIALLHRLAGQSMARSLNDFINSEEGKEIYSRMLLEIG